MEPRHLSPSSVRCFLSCPEQWRRRYVTKEPAASPMIFMRGKGLDEATRYLFVRKTVGLDTRREDFVQRAGDEHDRALRLETVARDISPEASRRQTERAAGAFYDQLADSLKPRSREDVQRTVRGIVPGLDVPLLGIVDLIAVGPVVVDVKFAGRVRAQADVDQDLQLSTYSLLTGIRDVAIAVATPDGEAAIVRSTRDAAALDETVGVYRRVLEAIRRDRFEPAVGSRDCSPRWCSYWDTCEWGAKAATPLWSVETTNRPPTLAELFADD